MREPNSIGFWRRNSIEGLRITLAATFISARGEPESLEWFQRNRAELIQLEARESLVMSRVARMRNG